MISTFLVFFAFALMFLSDVLKLHKRTAGGKLFFSGGMLVLIAAGALAALNGMSFYIPPVMKGLFLLIAAIGAWGLFSSLFFSLPASRTYFDKEDSGQLVDSGMYALCRHPGALWFPIFSCFSALGLGNLELLADAAFATLLNVLYVWFQDRQIFPQTIKEYKEYQETTPFLLPTAHSLSRAIGKKSKKQVYK